MSEMTTRHLRKLLLPIQNVRWNNNALFCSTSRILTVRYRQKLCVSLACSSTGLQHKVKEPQISSYLPTTGKEYSTNTSSTEEEEEEDDLYRLISLEMKGHDKAVLNSYTMFIVSTAYKLSLNCWVPERKKPKRHFDRRTLLKSAHVNKTAMVQYEIRTYYRIIHLKYLTGTTASVVLEYIERNLPEGVAMKVSKHRLERIPEHLVPPKETVET